MLVLSCISTSTEALPCEHVVEGGALHQTKFVSTWSVALLWTYNLMDPRWWAYSIFNSHRTWTKSMCTIPWISAIHHSVTSVNESFWCSTLMTWCSLESLDYDCTIAQLHNWAQRPFSKVSEPSPPSLFSQRTGPVRKSQDNVHNSIFQFTHNLCTYVQQGHKCQDNRRTP